MQFTDIDPEQGPWSRKRVGRYEGERWEERGRRPWSSVHGCG